MEQFTNPMNPSFSLHDLLATLPLMLVSAGAIAVLLAEALLKRTEGFNTWLTLAVLVAAGLAAYLTVDDTGRAYGGMVLSGGTTNYFAMVFALAGLLCVMLSRSYLRKEGIEHSEYYALLLISIAGMMIMAAAADLVIFFLGLEVMSVCFYVLAGFERKRLTSNEASLKYFLLGAFATGFVLYGIALVYGSVGTTATGDIAARAASLAHAPLFLIGLAMLLIGLVFKVAAVPFHMWVPDVYEGSPTTVSALMSTGGKAAAFSVFLIVFGPALLTIVHPLREVLAAVAALSMVVGNILAIAQANLKRMLAYSSIAHAGYILVGVVAANPSGQNGILFYLMAYTVMNVGAFGVLSLLESENGQNLTYDDYAGLSGKKPLVAALMALFMFSLAGVPPFAGFFGKYYVFAGAIQAGYTWLAIVGVLMSAVSAYYYLRLVVVMYFKEQVSVIEVPVPALGLAALILSALALVELGIYPSTVLHLTSRFF